jgi:hypothetical protein
MSRARVGRYLTACVLTMAAACTGGSSRVVDGASSAAPPTCDAALSVPSGFHVIESFKDPYPDHIGVRLGFRDRRRRELHYFAGIPGEFGEGLPSAGLVTVASGERAALLGRDGTWVLAWRSPGPCGSHALLGTGFSRKEFFGVLMESGIVPG